MPQWYEKQIGPLPAGIWVGVVAVGVGASTLINRRTKANAAAAPASDATVPASEGAFGSLPGGTNLGGVVALPSGVPAGQVSYVTGGSGSANITDNNQWLRAAENQLLAKGYDAALVDTALRKYIQGMAVSASEQAIVNLALQLLGSPPNPVIVPPTQPQNPSNPTGVQYGPIYPAQAPLPANLPCPPGYYLITGASGWTCATKSQWDALNAYLRSTGG